jgi:6-phospho-beta-glucosidase
VLSRLFELPERLASLYRMPIFDPDFLQRLHLIPTEYVYYYYRSREALENVRRAGRSRGDLIRELNDRLFRDLASASDNESVTVYERYLAERDGSYMQIESGAPAPRKANPWTGVTGYDKIALDVMRGIRMNSGAIIPLNVSNRGNIPELEPTDVVEIPCVVTANGALPLHVGAVPDQVRELLLQVKAYERLTARAALTGDPAAARQALAANPLVGDDRTADRLLGELTLA